MPGVKHATTQWVDHGQMTCTKGAPLVWNEVTTTASSGVDPKYATVRMDEWEQVFMSA